MGDSTGVLVWWAALGAVSVFNVGAWVVSWRWYARVRESAPGDVALERRHVHLVLSAVYVLVCAFRSLLPRADVQRICLYDTWLSSVLVGRSVATVAELCFATQWALLLGEYARDAEDRLARSVSRAIVPIIATAEVSSWYAVLSTCFFWNALENSLWGLTVGLIGVVLVRLAVARRNAENQRDTLEVVDSRARGGTATDFDLARARAQLATTIAAIPSLEAAAARAIHRLGVLVGEPPTALVRELSTPRPIPTLPPLLKIGDPGALVQRRADIRAADHALHAATARIGVAKADFFPRVAFNGRIALEANVLKDVGKAGNESYAFGPSISWAAFDMGRVNAYYQAAGARAEAAHARYRQTVLLALEDVESSLVTFGRERARRELLREAASANESAAELARERYRNGLADFLTVLDAERRVLESDDQLAEGETRTASALVAVYKALGGGWQ